MHIDGDLPIYALPLSTRAEFRSILDNIHRAGYIHNDMSCSNLLVGSVDATVCVVGFADCVFEAEGAQQGKEISINAEKENTLLTKILDGIHIGEEGHIEKRRRLSDGNMMTMEE